MSEWIDVPVVDVQTGDEVKVDGYGKRFEDSRAHGFDGSFWDSVSSVRGLDVSVTLGCGPVPGPHVSVRRSSIVSARRRKPEPAKASAAPYTPPSYRLMWGWCRTWPIDALEVLRRSA